MNNITKRIITFLLLIFILMNPISNGFLMKGQGQYNYAEAATDVNNKPLDELALALQAGLVTKDIISRSEENLSEKDFCVMLDKLLEKKLNAKIDDILKDTNLLLATFDKSGTYGTGGQLDLSKTKLHTSYGTTVKETLLQGHADEGYQDLILLGLEGMVKDYKSFRRSAKETAVKRGDAADRLWQVARMLGFDRDNYEQDFITYGGYKWEDVFSFAIYFVSGTMDKNGNRIMTAGSHKDTKVWFLPENAMITEDAIKAVYRLYNAEPPVLTSLEDVPTLTLTNEMKSYIAKCTLPNASYDNLPYWTGLNLTGKDAFCAYEESIGSTISVYSENQVRYYSELGFNCFRVNLHYRTISSYYDEEMIIMKQLENIDDLIKWGAKYNVHIMLEFQFLPGYGGSILGMNFRDIVTGKNEQELTIRYWKMFAKRYKDIPNNILSFNLLNEPQMLDDDKDGIYEGNETFWQPFITRIIEGVRSIDNNRLIISDTFVHRIPFPELLDDKVVQSIHIYDPPDICFNSYANSPPLEYKGDWPIPIVPERIYGKSNGKYVPFTINGDFPSGTKITVNIKSIFSDSNLVKLTVDTIGGSTICESKDLNRSFSGDITLTTKSDATGFVLYATPSGGGSYADLYLRDLVIIQPDGTTTDFYVTRLGCGNQPGDTRGFTLTVNEDGSYTSDSYIGNDEEKGIKDAWFDYLLKDYLKLRTGPNKVDIICGEFGIMIYTPDPIALGMMDTILQKLQENKIGWQLFASTGNIGFIYSKYKDTVLQEGYPVNRGRLNLLQKYMSEEPITENVKAISISKTSLELKVGDTYQLTAAVSNAKTASNPRIGWFTTNRSVASVDSKGNIKILNGGTATITAEAVDGSGVIASCTITVPEPVKNSMRLYRYETKSDYDNARNKSRVGIYSSFEEIKSAMDQAKNQKAYYEIDLSGSVSSKKVVISNYAKSVRISSKNPNGSENIKISLGNTLTTNVELVLSNLDITSETTGGGIYLVGNGKTITLDNCNVTTGTLDGKGKNGNTTLSVKNTVTINGNISNFTNLIIGRAINVEVDKYNNLINDTYQCEAAVLILKGALKNIETLSAYEGRLALLSTSSATFKNINGTQLFIYMGKAKNLAKVSFNGNVSTYHSVFLVATKDVNINDIWSAPVISLGKGTKVASVSKSVTEESLEKIRFPENLITWESIEVSRSGNNLLLGKSNK